MKLIKLNNDIEYIPKAMFKSGERGLQDLISNNLKTVFNTNFLGNETWIDFSKDSIHNVTHKKIDGRIDTTGITDKGVPVIIEYKQRDNKKMLNQSLAYAAWMLYKPESIKKYMIAQQEKDVIDIDIEPSFNYKPKIIMIAENHHIFDIVAEAMIRPDMELFYKDYELYKKNNERYLHIFDTARPKWVIDKAKAFLDAQSKLPADNIGHLNGFYIERDKQLYKTAKKAIKDLPKDIDEILEATAKELFTIDKIEKLKEDEWLGIENNGRAALILHSDNANTDILEYSLEEAKNLENKEKNINWDRKDHRIILVTDRDLTQREKDRIDSIEQYTETNWIFEPRWTTHYTENGESYLLVGRTALNSLFHTYPGKKNVYSMDVYVKNFKGNAELEKTFRKARKDILSLGKNVLEEFYNKSGITYSTDKQFMILEPHKSQISIRLSKPNEEGIYRYAIKNWKDLESALKHVKKAYEGSK